MHSKDNSNIYLLIRAEIRRIAWDLGKHLTLFVSAAALVALFFYIFKDFVGEQLATLSPELSQQGLKFLAIVGAVLTGTTAAAMMRGLTTTPRSFLPVMRRMGSSEQAIGLHKQGTVIIPLLLAASVAAGWCVLLQATNVNLCVAVAVATAVAGKEGFFASLRMTDASLRMTDASLRMTDAPLRMTKPVILSEAKNLTSINDWRVYQMIYHAMPGRGFLILSVIGACLLPFASFMNPHPFLIQTVALCMGLIASFGLVYAVAADLPGAWFEKQAGLTHDQWIGSWQKIANYLAFILLISGAIALLMTPAAARSQILAIPVVAGFLPWITPSLVLQIDGRSQGTNLMVMVLVGLFIGTAMIATPWAAIIVPILKSQAAGYQSGRFYRS